MKDPLDPASTIRRMAFVGDMNSLTMPPVCSSVLDRMRMMHCSATRPSPAVAVAVSR